VSRTRWSDDQLRESVPVSLSMAQLLSLLGLSPTGAGNRITVKRKIDDLGLDISHWQGQRWVGKRGDIHPSSMSLNDVLVEGSRYSTSALRKRLIKLGLKEEKCEECSLSEWRGLPIALELDHINGVSNDHRIDNLRMLCPNCHAQTPTWRGRNIKRKPQVSVVQVHSRRPTSLTS
jgi:Zn finger protein HypA/HybF involved in hydrogenase expression